MRTFRLYPLRLRAAAILSAAAVAAACQDDDPLAVREQCTPLRQTEADIEEGRETGMARVRLNVISRLGVEMSSTEEVSLQGAELYVGGECYRIDSASRTRLASLENDTGMLAVEASVAPGQVTELLLRASGPAGGRTYVPDRLRLEEPVELRPGMRTDIYVSLDPRGTSGNVEPRVLAAGTMPWNTTTMVFDPVRGGRMSLPGGFTMEMPVGSVAKPTVFGVEERTGRDVSSIYAIWPESTLQEPVTVTFPVNRANLPTGLRMEDYGGRVNAGTAVSSVEGNTATVTAAAGLGQIRMGTNEPYLETTGGQRLATRVPAGGATASAGPTAALVNNECSRRLAADRTNLYNTVNVNYGVRTTLCENVPPYVHIVLVNLNRAGLGSYPRIQFPSRRASDGRFELLEITTHLSGVNDFAGINGFTWTGDAGLPWGGYGTPNGTVHMNGVRVSPWFSGTEVIVGFGPYSASTGTPHRLFERVSGANLNIGGFDTWMVPSTTSIVKNGACSRTPGTDNNRWSTLGIGNGILVMASSVSNTTTTTYELCSIYEGLNVLGGAIRLDGSSAAAISWLGTTLNTLTGGDYATFGYERSIAYTVAALYP